jgi:ferrochelatase
MKLAIILFNLGGPDGPEAIKPFRVNLFSDPAIIRAPGFVRFFLARFIASLKVKEAIANYQLLGGKSPLLDITTRQARALEAALPEIDARAFVTMRYWHPFASEVAAEVKTFDPDEILLLPLYPQFSTTTTGSSVSDWHEAASKAGLMKKTQILCCYFDDPAYIASVAGQVRQGLVNARAGLPAGSPLRVLFSAHGLPESIILSGDPYQEEVEKSVAAVMATLGEPELDYQVCYQSRATPQQWLTPSTEDAIEKAAHDKTAVLVVPIAFVSDHIETLVELDVEYRHVADELGVPGYFRAPVANDDPAFITALAGLVRRTIASEQPLCSHRGARACSLKNKKCLFAKRKQQDVAAQPPFLSVVEPTELAAE